jgi:parallel beta-helix repeat protein
MLLRFSEFVVTLRGKGIGMLSIKSRDSRSEWWKRFLLVVGLVSSTCGSLQAQVEITVFAAGRSLTEEMALVVDGAEVWRWQGVGGRYDEGVFAAYRYGYRSHPSSVRVQFTNDRHDVGVTRDLRIDAIEVAGVRYEAEDAFSQGTWIAGEGCTSGMLGSEYLHCNGFFEFQIAQEVEGFRVFPGEDLAGLARNQPVNTVFVLAPGVYRRQSIKPKFAQSFIGEPGAILDGENQTQYAFYGSADDVILRGLEIKNYVTPDFNAAIEISDPAEQSNKGLRWVLENLTVHHNRSHGINLGNDTVVRNSQIHSNGLVGIGGRDIGGGLVENSVIRDNNLRNAYPDYHGGGIKLTNANGTTIRGNEVLRNTMVGLWCDNACNNWLVENNIVRDHYGSPGTGIHFEISAGATIRNNFIEGCGRPSVAWAWGAGVQVSTSSDVTVTGNEIKDCDTGIGIVQQERGSSEVPNIAVDRIVVSNNILWDAGRQPNLLNGAVSNAGNALFGRSLTFRNNVYRGGRAPVFFWLGSRYSWTQWQALGKGAGSSYQP